MGKEKIVFICFLLAALCFFAVAVMNYMDEDTAQAVTYLLLGITFLVLSTTHGKKTNKRVRCGDRCGDKRRICHRFCRHRGLAPQL